MPPEANWRNMPRKPLSLRKGARLTIRLRALDLERLRKAATAAEMTLGDYVLAAALRKSARRASTTITIQGELAPATMAAHAEQSP